MEDESLLNDFLEAAKLEPDDPLVLFGLASEYLKLNRYDEAIATAQHLIEVQKDYSAAYRILGQAYAGKGDVVLLSIPTRPAFTLPARKGTYKLKKKWKCSCIACKNSRNRFLPRL